VDGYHDQIQKGLLKVMDAKFSPIGEFPTLPLLQAIDPNHIELHFAKDKNYHIHGNLPTMVVNILDYCLHLLRHYGLDSTNSKV
jgi:hypothetical protein